MFLLPLWNLRKQRLFTESRMLFHRVCEISLACFLAVCMLEQRCEQFLLKQTETETMTWGYQSTVTQSQNDARKVFSIRLKL